MTKWLTLCVLAAFELAASDTRAEVINEPAAIIDAVMAGRVGAWLDEEATKKCLTADVENEHLDAALTTAEEQLDTCNRHRATVTLALAKDRKALDLMRVQVVDQESELTRLARELEKWYRNPLVIGIGGFIVGAAATTMIVVAVK